MNKPESVLVLAAHGSSHPLARLSLDGFTALVRRAHPGIRVLLAYTALRRTGNHPALNSGSGLAEVLAELEHLGPIAVRVQSLHVIAGDEFDRMREMLDDFSRRCGAAHTLSGPLLGGPEDIYGVANALVKSVGTLRQDESAVLMGHGTTHEAQDLYRSLAECLKGILPSARLGVLEAADPADPLSIQAIASDLHGRGVRSAKLIPFLTVAGRHAHKDLAGDQPGSWKSVLAEHTIATQPDLAGLLERQAFAAIWLKRLGSLLTG
ncbi:MAG: sirohydrochlorin cobaltochelatase [Desulfovibrio sp.]|nr:sirohydrochlorin cobaltochelatase [Desulfovibrio sp.]